MSTRRYREFSLELNGSTAMFLGGHAIEVLDVFKNYPGEVKVRVGEHEADVKSYGSLLLTAADIKDAEDSKGEKTPMTVRFEDTEEDPEPYFSNFKDLFERVGAEEEETPV